jgi:hypothetical protein
MNAHPNELIGKTQYGIYSVLNTDRMKKPKRNVADQRNGNRKPKITPKEENPYCLYKNQKSTRKNEITSKPPDPKGSSKRAYEKGIAP